MVHNNDGLIMVGGHIIFFILTNGGIISIHMTY